MDQICTNHKKAFRLQR